MNRFRKILSTISYIALGGGPLLAASGVGMPVAAAIGAVGVLAGGVLHFMDSPRTPEEARVLGEQIRATAAAVKAAAKPGKGQSGS